MKTWITDANNNRASIERWGNEEEARKALATLVDCFGCFDCSDCSRCSDCFCCSDCFGCSRCSDCFGCSRCSDCFGCSRCSDCSYCSRCSDCFGCFRCSDCFDCSRCSDCSDCFDCSDCSRCSDCFCCSDCFGCSRCSRCSDCSRCSYCSRCSGCSDCSRCSDCFDKNEEKQSATPIPVIEDIHRKVYEAARREGCLAMDLWHSCETTHCRAGWVVHLAGDAGYALEKKTSPLFAAQQIYKASGYLISPVRFFDSNEKALEDMKKLAVSPKE